MPFSVELGTKIAVCFAQTIPILFDLVYNLSESTFPVPEGETKSTFPEDRGHEHLL
jgi:hypothetical protein